MYGCSSGATGALATDTIFLPTLHPGNDSPCHWLIGLPSACSAPLLAAAAMPLRAAASCSCLLTTPVAICCWPSATVLNAAAMQGGLYSWCPHCESRKVDEVCAHSGRLRHGSAAHCERFMTCWCAQSGQSADATQSSHQHNTAAGPLCQHCSQHLSHHPACEPWPRCAPVTGLPWQHDRRLKQPSGSPLQQTNRKSRKGSHASCR